MSPYLDEPTTLLMGACPMYRAKMYPATAHGNPAKPTGINKGTPNSKTKL